ncbi:MAG: hypothetical protein RL568_1059 [Actinomycetota bacterium]
MPQTTGFLPAEQPRSHRRSLPLLHRQHLIGQQNLPPGPRSGDWAAKPATRTTVREAANRVRTSRPRRVNDAPDGLVEDVKGLEKPCNTPLLLANVTVLIVFLLRTTLGKVFEQLFE